MSALLLALVNFVLTLIAPPRPSTTHPHGGLGLNFDVPKVKRHHSKYHRRPAFLRRR